MSCWKKGEILISVPAGTDRKLARIRSLLGILPYGNQFRSSKRREPALVQTAALLVFLARSAGAWIVAADLAAGR